VSLATACASAPQPDPRYRPVQSVLEVVATLRHHVPDDTYRFEPARDFTGRNVYRSALIRLYSLETAHSDALRAGHLDYLIAFANASFCDALDEASWLGPELHRPLRNGQQAPLPGDPDEAIEAFDQRTARLETLSEATYGTHYAPVVEEEIERADLARARFFVARRHLEPEGDVRALAELQRVVGRHRESKNASRHLLALADLYAELAEEYVEARPPESLRFDPPAFQELVDSASRLYGAVANQDGTTEKLEAARRLEAFLAFTLRVDRDRFSR
jgi:hypothetical protein